MNLNQLWAGQDYAYYDMRGRGEIYRPHAQRVRVVKAYPKKIWGNNRFTGYAEVIYLTPEGEPIKIDYGTNKGKTKIVEIRARDIAMPWEDYEAERDHRNAEAERLRREQEEAKAREQAARTALLDAIVETYGIPRDMVTSIDDYSVRISRPGLEKELHLV